MKYLVVVVCLVIVAECFGKVDIPLDGRLQRTASLYAKRYVMHRFAKSNGELCDECVAILTEAADALKSATVQDDIKQFIDNEICKQLGSMAGACVEFVELALPEILTAVEGLLQNPKQVCIDIDLCSGSAADNLIY